MIADVKSAFLRSRATLLEDALGAVALMVTLIVGLHLPGMF